jgi:hypothetical protein
MAIQNSYKLEEGAGWFTCSWSLGPHIPPTQPPSRYTPVGCTAPAGTLPGGGPAGWHMSPPQPRWPVDPEWDTVHGWWDTVHGCSWMRDSPVYQANATNITHISLRNTIGSAPPPFPHLRVRLPCHWVGRPSPALLPLPPSGLHPQLELGTAPTPT